MNMIFISGQYEPFILALAEGMFCFAHQIFCFYPPQHGGFVPQTKGWGRKQIQETKWWGKKHIRTNKRVGTEAHTKNQNGGT
jgi:hypothetical protein